jgi:hypothetical protein
LGTAIVLLPAPTTTGSEEQARERRCTFASLCGPGCEIVLLPSPLAQDGKLELRRSWRNRPIHLRPNWTSRLQIELDPAIHLVEPIRHPRGSRPP